MLILLIRTIVVHMLCCLHSSRARKAKERNMLLAPPHRRLAPPHDSATSLPSRRYIATSLACHHTRKITYCSPPSTLPATGTETIQTSVPSPYHGKLTQHRGRLNEQRHCFHAEQATGRGPQPHSQLGLPSYQLPPRPKYIPNRY